MKKYILGLFFIFVMFFSISHNAFALKRTCRASNDCTYTLTNSSCAHSGCGCTFNEGGEIYKGVVKSVTDVNGHGFVLACQQTLIAQRPHPIGEPITSPVPKISITAGDLNQYIFKTYPFTYLPISVNQPLFPVNDPLVIGKQNPSDPSVDNPMNTPNTTDVVPALFGSISSNISVVWPPASLFDNMNFWNKPMADTFKTFTNSTFSYNGAVNSKWYPLNYFTVANPITKIPLIPTTINWKEVPGASSYHFILVSSDNPLGLDTNIPAGGIDVSSTTTRSYTASLRGKVSYVWKAIPLNAVGQEILGPEIIKNSVYTLVQGNLNSNQLNPYYTYGWNAIPGAVNYQIQYALSFNPIPEGTNFAEGSTFTENGRDITGAISTPYTVTTHVLVNNIAPSANEYSSGFHDFDLANSSLSNIQSNIPFQYLNWRVRAIDANGLPIRENITPSGTIDPVLPKTPYQSGYPVWNKVAGATSYIVDVAENIADFDKLPNLTTTGTLPTLSTSIAKISLINGTTISPTTDSNDVFLLRKVVPEISYDASKITVARMSALLKEMRVSLLEENDSWGMYDYLQNQDPTVDYQAQDENMLNTFNSNSPSAYADYPATLDYFYPKITSTTGMTITSPTANQIKLVTTTPITIKNLSTGNAKLTIVQTADKKTTTLTFTINPAITAIGAYAFDITRGVFQTGDGITTPITYSTIGPMPVLPNLATKGYTEFTKLLPGTKYYYRVRGLRDTNPQNKNVPFIFYPWSAVSSFTTETGVPASVTIGSDGSLLESTFQMKGEISKITPSVVLGQKSLTIASPKTIAPVSLVTTPKINIKALATARTALITAIKSLATENAKANTTALSAVKNSNANLLKVIKGYSTLVAPR